MHDHTCMAARELEDFLAFNMRNTHVSEIYADDYYYEAFLNKYFGACNARRFRPAKLYARAPHEKADAEEAAHAKVDGLGKFVYASLRTPRQLLAVDGARAARRAGAHRTPFPETIAQALGPQGSNAAAAGPADSSARHASDGGGGIPTLHKDRNAAARKVIEDCNYQLLDVDDADRALAAQRAAAMEGEAPNERDTAYYIERRALLMDNIADVLRVRGSNTSRDSNTSDGPGEAADDSVFRFLLTTHKGRALVSRVLERIIVPGRQKPQKPQGVPLLAATLRTARVLFGNNVAPPPATDLITPEEEHLVRASTAVAAAAAATLRCLRDPAQVLVVLEAFAASDVVSEVSVGSQAEAEALGVRGLLPLLLLESSYTPDDNASWLGTVLIALFEVCVSTGVSTGVTTSDAFRRAFGTIFDRILTHLRALIGLLAKARATQVAAAVESVQALCAVPVLYAMLPVCTPAEETKLVEPLQAIVGGGAR